MKVTFPVEARVYDIPVTVHLCYDSAEPYTVAVKIKKWAVTWLLARDLLAAGQVHPHGDGAIKVIPGPEHIVIRLYAPPDVGVLRFARDDIETFLHTTFLAIPAGTEHEHLDWSGLDELLTGGAA